MEKRKLEFDKHICKSLQNNKKPYICFSSKSNLETFEGSLILGLKSQIKGFQNKTVIFTHL